MVFGNKRSIPYAPTAFQLRYFKHHFQPYYLRRNAKIDVVQNSSYSGVVKGEGGKGQDKLGSRF